MSSSVMKCFCSFLSADRQADSFLNSPLAGLFDNVCNSSPLSAGTVLCGRFRIVLEVGQGGMGHVYEAFDTELSVRIALKTVKPRSLLPPKRSAGFARR